MERPRAPSVAFAVPHTQAAARQLVTTACDGGDDLGCALLGKLLVNSNQTDAAADAFKHAIELTPTYADSYYQYGVTLVGKAKMGADGKVTPVPGTVEAFQKYLELQPSGTHVAEAQAMLQAMGEKVETNTVVPGAKSTSKKKK